MELKIFTSGFAEKEVNTFIAKNIVYKMNSLENGDIYVWFKNPNKLGNDVAEMLETCDKMVKQAQNEILATSIDVDNHLIQVADLKEKQSKVPTNKPEWDKLEAEIKSIETRIKMSTDTIADRRRMILGIQTQANGILRDA